MSLISRKMLKRRPQELGKIKIGGLGEERQAQSGRTYRLPVKYDHFIVTRRDREGGGNARGNFVKDEKAHERLGPEPTEIPGHLMFHTPEENFHAEMVEYDGQTKVVSCDGEERTDLRSGEVRTCPVLEGGECKCKPYSRLHLQLWADPVGFYRVFRTTSWESTNNIQSALEDFYERFGSLYHLPVKLIIYPATVSYEDGSQTKTSQSYMVGLVLAASMEEVAQEMVRARRLTNATQAEMKRLSGEVQEEQTERDREEAEAIAAEFFPRPNVQTSVETQSKLDDLKAEMGVEGEDFEIIDDEDTEAEAGPRTDPENGEGESGAHGRPPAEASPQGDTLYTLKKELADLMAEHAPDLLNDKEVRRRWTHRLIGKASPRTASEFELQQLIAAVKNGDTDPEPEAEAGSDQGDDRTSSREGGDANGSEPPAEASTPFDDDAPEQEEMPA